MNTLRVGIAHHFGWAVAVVADVDGRVVGRHRVDLVEPGVAAAPIHHEGAHLGDDDALALVAQVRASAARATAQALDELARAAPAPIDAIVLREWASDFPTDIAVLRRVPYEARADSVMYRQVLADAARVRGWQVLFFDAGTAEAAATEVLGERADEVLHGPRRTLGTPWAKDHRVALAAVVLSFRESPPPLRSRPEHPVGRARPPAR